MSRAYQCDACQQFKLQAIEKPRVVVITVYEDDEDDTRHFKGNESQSLELCKGCVERVIKLINQLRQEGCTKRQS